MNRRHSSLAFALAVSFVACQENPPAPTRDAAGSAAKTTPSAKPSGSTAPAGSTGAAKGDAPVSSAKGPFPESTNPALLDISKAEEKAPDTFKAKFETTAGDFVVECTRAWAPHGADRFYNLVKIGYFDDIAIFRVQSNFVAQWGIHGNPKVSAVWQKANIEPDTVTESNKKGTLTFAQAGEPAEKGKTAAMRSTQVFINYGDNDNLDDMGFAPICKITEGFENTLKFGGSKHASALTNAQAQIFAKGNAFLRQVYPELDYIKTARLLGADDSKKEGDDKEEPKGEEKGQGKDEGKGEGKGDGTGSGEGSGKGDGSGSGKGKGGGKGGG
jgi:peptidyl-prolyl cis-trans isomerase A (cyclophilin A)